MPTFICNPSWHGEIRKRPSHVARVDATLLDLALDCAWVLCRFVFAASADPAKIMVLTALKRDVSRVRGQANELRHLSELMNHKKY